MFMTKYGRMALNFPILRVKEVFKTKNSSFLLLCGARSTHSPLIFAVDPGVVMQNQW
jgi:hypothetical protein